MDLLFGGDAALHTYLRQKLPCSTVSVFLHLNSGVRPPQDPGCARADPFGACSLDPATGAQLNCLDDISLHVS